MKPLRIFLSSVQKEFAQERAALRDYLRGDALMRRCFEVFLFEEMPAADRRADSLYLDELDHSDLYLGRFGNRYGFDDTEPEISTEERICNDDLEGGPARVAGRVAARDRSFASPPVTQPVTPTSRASRTPCHFPWLRCDNTRDIKQATIQELLTGRTRLVMIVLSPTHPTTHEVILHMPCAESSRT